MAYRAAISAHSPQVLHLDKTQRRLMASRSGLAVTRVRSDCISDRQAIRAELTSSRCGAANDLGSADDAGTARAAAASIRATSYANRCMITPKGCDHATSAAYGQGFLCVSCRACSSAIATTRAQASDLSLPSQRSRKASADRSKQAASRSRSPWSRQRNSVRASKPNAYRNIASSSGGVLVSVMATVYGAETQVFHASQGATQHGLNRESAPNGKSHPKRGA